MGISQTITDLFAKKQEIEKEIVTLQKSCNHCKKSVKQVRERVDSTSPVIRWIFNDCLKIIGYPSERDRINFFKE